MHTLEFLYTFGIFEFYTIICSHSYYTQGLRDFETFGGVSVIGQKVKTFVSKFLTNELQPKLPQIVLLEQLDSSTQILITITM